MRLAAGLFGVVALGACTSKGRSLDESPVEAESRSQPATAARPLDASPPPNEVEIRMALLPNAGPGWVTTEYVNRLVYFNAQSLTLQPDQRVMASFYTAAKAFQARIPDSMLPYLRAVAGARADDRVAALLDFIASHQQHFDAICARCVDTGCRTEEAPAGDGAKALFDACELSRFHLDRRDNPELALPLFAAVLHAELEAQGGVLPLERMILRDMSGLPALPSASHAEQRAVAAAALPADTGPAPQPWEAAIPPPGVEAVTYPSGELALGAWLAVPAASSRTRAPALVYFHGGFAFAPEDFEVTRPFREAGFVVMAPTVRGENGNPGSFQLLLGEVDDAAAAVRWLAQRPEVDPSRIYAFGHSVGGGLAALLTLVEDLPLTHSGSAGGLYLEHDIEAIAESGIAPFDPLDRAQTSVRVLFGHLEEMSCDHHAWFGVDDPLAFNARIVSAMKRPGRLATAIVAGDHETSLEPAIEAYLVCVSDETQCPTQPDAH